MSVLCGDFVFSGFKNGIKWYIALEPKKDTDLIRFKNNMSFTGKCIDYGFFYPRGKTPKISEDIQKVYINTPEAESTSGKSIASLIVELAPFLGLWEDITRYEDKYIYIGGRVEKTMGMFASQVLPLVSYAKVRKEPKQKVNGKIFLKNRSLNIQSMMSGK